jgi:hypothetical protein
MTRCLCLVATVLALTASPVAAQRFPISPRGTARLNAANDAIRKENAQSQKLQQAERELVMRERQAIAAAAEQVAAAKIAHRMAGKDLVQAREDAAASIEQSLGLKAAQEELTRVQVAFKEVSEPVLRQLKETAEYKAAEKKSDAARAAIKALQADATIAATEKKARLSDLVGESMTASNLERLALRKDVRVNAARERLEAAQQKVAELRKKAGDQADTHPSVVAAQGAIKAARDSVEAAEANLIAVRKTGVVAAQFLQAGALPNGAEDGKGKPAGDKKN